MVHEQSHSHVWSPPNGQVPGRAGRKPGRLAARARGRGGIVTGPAKTQLLAALADVGVEPDDYAAIEQARALVDGVNERLRARGSRMVYTVTFCNAPPLLQSDWATVMDAAQLPEL
jgi:hypothetical protein